MCHLKSWLDTPPIPLQPLPATPRHLTYRAQDCTVRDAFISPALIKLGYNAAKSLSQTRRLYGLYTRTIFIVMMTYTSPVVSLIGIDASVREIFYCLRERFQEFLVVSFLDVTIAQKKIDP